MTDSPTSAGAQTPPSPERPSLPPVTPERAFRRQLPGRAGAWAAAAAVSVLAALPSALWWRTTEAAPPALLPPRAPSPARTLEVKELKAAFGQLRSELEGNGEPAAQLMRVEAKRSAARGAVLVDQEMRRLQQEQLHTLELEAALTRQPSLAQKKHLPPLPPAALEPFLRRVGLTSPSDAVEGEVTLDEGDRPLGAAMPESFAALVAASRDGPAQKDGRVAHRMPVGKTGLSVVAIRRLPEWSTPPALDALSHAADGLAASAEAPEPDEGPASVPDMKGARGDGQGWLVLVNLILALAAGGVVLRSSSRQLARVRTTLQEARAGATSTSQTPASDEERMLRDLVERARTGELAAADARAHRATLDAVLDACRRATEGDLSARVPLGPGTEGLVADAVSRLVEAMEQRVMKVRALAVAILDVVGSQPEPAAAPLSPAVRAPLDALAERLENLQPLVGLLKTLSSRLETLAAQMPAGTSRDELGRLAQAVAPRAQAVSSLLADMTEHHGKLKLALGTQTGVPVSDGWQRVKQAAQDLAQEARSIKVGARFPEAVQAVRGLPGASLDRVLDKSTWETQ